MKPLGGLRFVLACCVLGGHAFRLIEDSVPTWAAASGAIAAQLGVLMFFVVSGYIICFAIERNYAHRPIAFLVNRALRIYPIHLTCYVLALAFLWKIAATPYGWVPKITREGITALPDLLILPHAAFLPNPPMWSVAVEMQFYIAIGIATFLPWRHAAYFILGLLASVATICELSYMRSYFFCFFALGGSIYYIRSRWGFIVAGVSLAATLKYMLIITNRLDIPNISMTVTALLALGIFAWLVLSGRKANEVDNFLGGLSYPLYAVHVPILAVTAQNLRGVSDFLLVCTLCVVVSIGLYLVVEKPSARLRARFRQPYRSRDSESHIPAASKAIANGPPS